MKKQKGFSLISLMVVIIILGILAVIAVPNIKNIADNARISKAKQDNSTIQTSVDRYFLNNNSFPVSFNGKKGKIKEGSPKRIKFPELKGSFINKAPEKGDFYYWINNEGTVTTSNVDAPINISVSDGGVTWDISWDEVDEAKEYSVGFYDVNNNFELLNSQVLTNSLTVNKTDYDLSDKEVVIKTISEEFESPYASSNYQGNYLGKIEDFKTGNSQSYALMVDGTVKSWGENEYGELGRPEEFGTTVNSATPKNVEVLSNIVQLEIGRYHVLALTKDGDVYAWGRNNYGQLGNNGADTYTPTKVVGVSNAVQIAAGKYTSLALLEDGSILTWGRNNYGELGRSDNFGTLNSNQTPSKMINIDNVKKITAKNYNSFALLEDGTVMSWGREYYGILGRAGGVDDYTPGLVTGLIDVEDISAGEHFVLVRLTNGTLKSWGSNEFGQLGNPVNAGTSNQNETPVDVIGISNARQIKTWKRNAMAILNDGTVMSWGRNQYGQLGYSTNEGTDNPNDIPSQIAGLNDVRLLGDGYGRHTFAILEDGSIKGWGLNSDEQLDIDKGYQESTPFEISYLK